MTSLWIIFRFFQLIATYLFVCNVSELERKWLLLVVWSRHCFHDTTAVTTPYLSKSYCCDAVIVFTIPLLSQLHICQNLIVVTGPLPSRSQKPNYWQNAFLLESNFFYDILSQSRFSQNPFDVTVVLLSLSQRFLYGGRNGGISWHPLKLAHMRIKLTIFSRLSLQEEHILT